VGNGFFIDPTKIENETKLMATAAGYLNAANDILKGATMPEGALTALGQLPQMHGAKSLPDAYNGALKTVTDKTDTSFKSILGSITVIEKDILAQYQGTDADNMKSIIFAGSDLNPDGTEKTTSALQQNYSESLQPYSGK
jgi:hypothetical protein